MTLLPWLLLRMTLVVRYLLASGNHWGWWLDLVSVPSWLIYYASRGDYPLLAVPLLFAALDVRAIWRWSR